MLFSSSTNCLTIGLRNFFIAFFITTSKFLNVSNINCSIHFADKFRFFGLPVVVNCCAYRVPTAIAQLCQIADKTVFRHFFYCCLFSIHIICIFVAIKHLYNFMTDEQYQYYYERFERLVDLSNKSAENKAQFFQQV